MRDERDKQAGEHGLELWISAFRGPLIGLIASWGSDWRAAEELAQDTFAEAWLSQARFAGDFSDREALGAWLRGIALNLHRAALRRAQRGSTSPLMDREPVAPEVELDPRRAALAEGFRKLSATHQTVLRMHYLEQTSAKQVAALLGLTPKAVESRLYQARKALRAELDRAEARKPQELRS